MSFLNVIKAVRASARTAPKESRQGSSKPAVSPAPKAKGFFAALPDEVVGGIYFRGQGFTSPATFNRALTARSEAAMAEFRRFAKRAEMEEQEAKASLLSRGEVRATIDGAPALISTARPTDRAGLAFKGGSSPRRLTTPAPQPGSFRGDSILATAVEGVVKPLPKPVRKRAPIVARAGRDILAGLRALPTVPAKSRPLAAAWIYNQARMLNGKKPVSMRRAISAGKAVEAKERAIKAVCSESGGEIRRRAMAEVAR